MKSTTMIKKTKAVWALLMLVIMALNFALVSSKKKGKGPKTDEKDITNENGDDTEKGIDDKGTDDKKVTDGEDKNEDDDKSDDDKGADDKDADGENKTGEDGNNTGDGEEGDQNESNPMGDRPVKKSSGVNF
ncbi:hypothetical protein NERG_02060 [Nematocida ausubeli]|uniref:Uncharacterized protein n=1 Tax=Nematocida ausubeli (strain ATCC PRA-371 / ERTm2) TaxID=1913371 RepID=H8ZEN9_NEMA1|nr:hypothetical protein NERG_02060 [Nematocida ausubeli]